MRIDICVEGVSKNTICLEAVRVYCKKEYLYPGISLCLDL